MAAPASLIPELEEVVQHGSPERRADALKRITAFFLERRRAGSTKTTSGCSTTCSVA